MQFSAPEGRVPGRTNSMDVSPDGGTWDGNRGSIIRDRPNEIHRPRKYYRLTPQAMKDHALHFLGQPGFSVGSDCCYPVSHNFEPEETATIDMIFGIAETRDIVLSLIEKYQDQRLARSCLRTGMDT